MQIHLACFLITQAQGNHITVIKSMFRWIHCIWKFHHLLSVIHVCSFTVPACLVCDEKYVFFLCLILANRHVMTCPVKIRGIPQQNWSIR